MSDGGGKQNGKESEHNNNTRKSARNEDFVLGIAKIAVAQVCENEGFQGFQQSALEALADVAVRYIREIGKTANLHANLAGSSDCSVWDVIQGLEDLGSIQGFPGASDVHHSLANSGTIREISQYVSLVDEIPFVYSLPKFPVRRSHEPSHSFYQRGEEPPGDHIPAWLPAFPRHQSHTDGPTCNGGQTGAPVGGREEQETFHKNGEPPLLDMQQRLTANDGSLEIFGPNAIDISKIKKPTEINPFLEPPLPSGEKEVSSFDLPSRLSGGGFVANHVNVMDTFAPIVEAAKNKLSETVDKNEDIRLGGRPTVRFKFSSLKKSLTTSMNMNAQNDGDGKLANCFERDDQKEEKKRRAVQILKESMENPSGPAQL